MKTEELIILYEDNHIIVVLKPQMVPCCPDESGDSNLFECVKEYIRVTYSKQGNVFLGLVHRLDRPTGGVMMFAKTSKCAERLCEAIKNGDVDKKYLAVLDGVPRYKADKLCCHLKKFSDTNTVRIVPALTEGAKYAELDYKMLSEKDGRSLVSVKLITGRGHQIRVQMAGMGTPIAGDKRYGNGAKQRLPLCLWATELRLSHPISGKTMVFRVYPPEIAPWTSFNIDAFLKLSVPNDD